MLLKLNKNVNNVVKNVEVVKRIPLLVLLVNMVS